MTGDAEEAEATALGVDIGHHSSTALASSPNHADRSTVWTSSSFGKVMSFSWNVVR